MADDINWVNSAISAAAGLLGVALGAGLTAWREARQEGRQRQRDMYFLAALVAAHLDRFAIACLAVADDDGTREGLPAGGDGQYHQTTVSRPTFDPLELEVEWKVLPPNLLTEILGLPFAVEQIEDELDAVWQFDMAPEYPEFFWTRQERYADLGLKVSSLAVELRKFAGLDVVPGEPPHEDRLRKQRDRVRRERQRYDEQTKSIDFVGELQAPVARP